MRKKSLKLYKSRLTGNFTHGILNVYGFMLKNLTLISLWFVLVPFLLVFAIYLAHKQDTLHKLVENYPSIAANEFEINNNIDGQVLGTKIEDIRPYILSNFLDSTPLEPYSDYIVEVSDKYALDYRLIPAIAMKESGGGTAIDETTHNAWGWDNGRTNFSSWESAIEIVGKTLKEKYIAKGLETPEEIMTVYAPPQIYTGGEWARDINNYFLQMESL